MKTVKLISKELKSLSNAARARILAGFFKTGEGEYGEGDVFYGITVPQTRLVARKYSGKTTFEDAGILLDSPVHEERLVALLILVDKFQKASGKERKSIFNFYLKNSRKVNNWDLVDLSADKIVGSFLQDNPNLGLLKKLAQSENVWERRIAIIATFHYLKKGSCKEAFEIAEMLLQDEHVLIQKAVGWILREAGKRCSEKALTDFLGRNARKMPRTMLRYAI